MSGTRILGHASVTTTLNIYTHLFDDARHATEIRTRMAASPFARLLEPDHTEADNVVAIARRRSRGAARRRLAVDRARTWPQLDYARQPPLGAVSDPPKPRSRPFAGPSMELAGLEPATSWVRCLRLLPDERLCSKRERESPIPSQNGGAVGRDADRQPCGAAHPGRRSGAAGRAQLRAPRDAAGRRLPGNHVVRVGLEGDNVCASDFTWEGEGHVAPGRIEVRTMAYKERVRYRPPRRCIARLNRLVGRLAALGLAPSDTVELEVPGRRTGKPRRVSLVWAEHQGNRYLVSLAGESEWVRNVRAADYRAQIRHGRRQHVRLEEVPVGERAPIL